MSANVRFCFLLHNHQPIGNFDGVFEDAYQDSYLPYLDLFEQFDLPMALHTSGPLLEWMDQNHPEYLDRLADLVSRGRIEIVGGAFYEPILTMIPRRDRIGQIRTFSEYLENRLGANVQGMWVPERVWEQSLAADIAEAGIRYTVLDDFHFKNAGLQEDQLHGYYTTEDEGRLLNIFPGSEPLRYRIPFASPQETIDHLRQIAEQHPGAVVMFGDDGEKFGTWPETKQHVYDNGWLRNFLQALTDNRDWLHMTTPAEAIENVAPIGKIYLPEGSYREMTEWALPTDKQVDYENLTHELEHDERWSRIQRFVRGGYWRNFKVKYPETGEMYARMMQISRQLHEADRSTADAELLDAARRELYRGQCNCSYWHGAFGGVYLPHLRNGVYNHLIAAENLLNRATGKTGPWVEAIAEDYNFDARQEVRLASDKLTAMIAPAAGGQIYELDVHSICHNLLATLTRRPEAYHRKVLKGPQTDGDDVASIHDRIVFKQEGLDQRLQYDSIARKSMIDHFYDSQTPLEAVARGEAPELGDFANATYETRIRRNADRIQVQLTREGFAEGVPIKITKGLTLEAGSSTLEIGYLLEGLPVDRQFHFASEWNFAGLPSGADDRYFFQGEGQRLGQLGTHLNLENATRLGLADEWLGIKTVLTTNCPTHFWTFPVETVSQSEGGFELVHQSVTVLPHWYVQADEQGRWGVTMHLEIDTSLAESRMEETQAAAVR